ncbi:MAG TPA: hypothetical protein PLM33_05075 [Acidobacteriota bacterium]|nr:hypothetical protein [Acidobacteriota bacterium]HRR57134.1 hypothetical protein [Acidobacteriota bacterium]HRV07748.1 hypothetical protein [Acidobacteriota bacterium]
MRMLAAGIAGGVVLTVGAAVADGWLLRDDWDRLAICVKLSEPPGRMMIVGFLCLLLGMCLAWMLVRLPGESQRSAPELAEVAGLCWLMACLAPLLWGYAMALFSLRGLLIGACWGLGVLIFAVLATDWILCRR